MTRKGFIEKFRDTVNSGTGDQLRDVYRSSRQLRRDLAEITRDIDRIVAANKRRGQITSATDQQQEAEPSVSERPPTNYSADLTLRDEAELALITFVKRLGLVAVHVACIALLIALL